MFEWIKKLIKKKKKFYSIPQRFGIIEFIEEAENVGLGMKHLVIFNSGKVERILDYSVTLIKALQKHQHIPIFDSTGGKSHPKAEVFVEYNPSVIDLRW